MLVISVRVTHMPPMDMWKSETNLQMSILSSNHMVFRDRTQVIRLGGRHLYPLSHLAHRSVFNAFLV